MRAHLQRVLPLFVAFILGCVAAPHIVPSATAQGADGVSPVAPRAGSQPMRWQFHLIQGSYHRRRTDLQQLGAQGWELVAVADNTMFFKRPY